MTNAQRLARLMDLQVRATRPGAACPECTAPVWPEGTRPRGLLSTEEQEAILLRRLGGELFAAWPRCRRCGRLDMRFWQVVRTHGELDAFELQQMVQEFRAAQAVAS
jgi:hypothetical protein